MECKNCGHDFEGNYCPECGQKVIEERFSGRKLLADLWEVVTNLDRGFWYTLRMLAVAPQTVVNQYLNGATRKFQNPFQFLFIIVGVSAFINLKLGMFELQQSEMQRIMFDNTLSEAQKEMQLNIQQFMRSYLSFVFMAAVPFFSLSCHFLFRKKRMYNFSEFLIINIFANGFIFFVYGLIEIFIKLFSLKYGFIMSWIIWISMINSIVYYAWLFHGLFNFSWLKSILYSVLNYALMFTLLILVSGFIGSIWGAVMFIAR
jgi:hypothetical protein